MRKQLQKKQCWHNGRQSWVSGCWCGDHVTAVSLKEEWNHSLRMRSCGPLNRQLTQCCLPSFLYQLSISILSLASALTPTQVRRSQFREVTCLEANPTAVKRKKRKKETKQKKKKLSTRSAPRSNSQNDHTRASASTMEKVETQSQRQ